MKIILTSIATALLLAHGAAVASTHAAAAQPTTTAPAAASTATMTEGEVRKVDKENRKVTLKHGEIKNLDMPGMTMVFQVKEPSMLDSLKTGDKVRFTADKVNGAFTVTGIEVSK